MPEERKIQPLTGARAKPLFGELYGWKRISHEAQVIKHLKDLGGIELKPPKQGPGF